MTQRRKAKRFFAHNNEKDAPLSKCLYFLILKNYFTFWDPKSIRNGRQRDTFILSLFHTKLIVAIFPTMACFSGWLALQNLDHHEID